MRAVLWAAYVAYLVVLGYLVLSPNPEAAGSGVHLAVELLQRAGFASATERWVEIGLNVALFVPLGAGGVLLMRALPWWLWALVGLALSGSLETLQGYLPSRVPSLTDLAANTAGALLGAALGAVAVREVRATRSGRTAQRPLLPAWVLVPAVVMSAAVMVGLLFSPTAALANQYVQGATRLMVENHAPSWLGSVRLWERTLNVFLFVPVGFLAVMVRPGWSWLRWVAAGFLASLLVEVAQGALLPQRDASGSDLIMNTVGMLVGVLLARALAAVARPAGRGGRPGGRNGVSVGSVPAKSEG